MAREKEIYQWRDSRFWWIDVVLPSGQRVCQSSKTETRKEAEALAAKLRSDSFRQSFFGIKQRRSWQEAVVRYLTIKPNLRNIEDTRRILRKLDVCFGSLMLDEISGDQIWALGQGQLKKGNKPATINRYLAVIHCLLRAAREEW
jgi:hypothetical protein